MFPLTLRSILAATELSGDSDDILRAAGALAALCGAELHVLHAFDLQDSPYTGDLGVTPTFQRRIADAERALDGQIGRTLGRHAAVASRRVVIRTAFKAVVERARDVAADLIVLGPSRRRPAGQRVLGSTADRVIRTAEAPCLIVRGPVSLPLRRVVVPVDLSDYATGALETALSWGLAFGAPSTSGLPAVEVRVVHVVPSLFDLARVSVGHAVIGPELDRETEAALERVEGSSALDVREELLWGEPPAEEIVRYAEDNRAGLIVLGTHGYGAVRRAVVGSVASEVARRASCAVLLVPPQVWGGIEATESHDYAGAAAAG
ncbi:MAG TPA: universal stress protein [Longimicrobiaceae bacterium]|nr:universal stress protein [Longimicrobiaceae bacterium]